MESPAPHLGLMGQKQDTETHSLEWGPRENGVAMSRYRPIKKRPVRACSRPWRRAPPWVPAPHQSLALAGLT